MLEGKKIQASDDINYLGISKEIRDFREKYNQEPLWTNSLFGGMPAYQISRKYKGNIFETIDKKVIIIPKPAQYLFLTLAGFYLMLLLFGVEWRISAIGAIAFSFSSYLFIIAAVGHNAQAAAMAYMAPMIGSVFYAYRKKFIPGLLIFAFSFAMQLTMNHVQITYYTFLIVFLLIAFILYQDIKDHAIMAFLKKSLGFLIVGIVVIGTNFSNLYFTYDYSKDSTRGKPDITLTDSRNVTSGLDKDYALQWSYGIDETLTVLIPDFKGGESGGAVPKSSETYKLFEKAQGPRYAEKVIKHLPTYWGNQPFTQGPVYFGAIVIFLFVLALFVYKGNLKWWLLILTILSVALAWGKNFEWFSHLFLDYFPGYNKFRSVTMILVIAGFTVPVLAFLGLYEIMKGNIPQQKLIKYLKYSLIIVGGICLFFALFPRMFYSFDAPGDSQYLKQQGGEQLVSAFRDDRCLLLRNDALRSLFFVLSAAIIVFLSIKKKIKETNVYILLAVFILIDMWMVDKRYMNNDLFTSKREMNDPIKATKADTYILNDKEPDYRVLNLTTSPFQDATTSYFHKSIGGYHAAKMKRYQNFIDLELTPNLNELIKGFKNPEIMDSIIYGLNGLNMLNTKYIIYNADRPPLVNSFRYGEAWLVKGYKLAENADEELLLTKSEDTRHVAVIDKTFKNLITDFTYDSTATIKMTSYLPNQLEYDFISPTNELVVFSEIYYPKGWNAYIDGKLENHFRADFLLRAMIVPAGNHKIEFKFEPKMYNTANNVSRTCSGLLVLLIIGGIAFEYKKSKKIKKEA